MVKVRRRRPREAGSAFTPSIGQAKRAILKGGNMTAHCVFDAARSSDHAIVSFIVRAPCSATSILSLAALGQ